MDASVSRPTTQQIAPDEWPSSSEQAYARRIQTLASEYGVDVESHVVDTGVAGRIHYLTAGDPDGAPVVLLHGGNVPGATWIPLLSALTDEYRLYVPDRPGLGLSEPYSYSADRLRSTLTSYLCELFEAENLDRPHVVGNSLGGFQGFLLDIDRDRADSLCLVGAPPGLSTTGVHILFKLMGTPGTSKLLYWLLYRDDSPDGARNRMEQFAVEDSSALPDSYFELLATHQRLPERLSSERSLGLAQIQWFRPHSVFDLGDEIVDIERQTRFIWGTEDAFWEPSVGRSVAEQMSDSEFHELHDHGHMPWLEPGDQVADLVRAFLDETSR